MERKCLQLTYQFTAIPNTELIEIKRKKMWKDIHKAESENDLIELGVGHIFVDWKKKKTEMKHGWGNISAGSSWCIVVYESSLDLSG